MLSVLCTCSIYEAYMLNVVYVYIHVLAGFVAKKAMNSSAANKAGSKEQSICVQVCGLHENCECARRTHMCATCACVCDIIRHVQARQRDGDQLAKRQKPQEMKKGPHAFVCLLVCQCLSLCVCSVCIVVS